MLITKNAHLGGGGAFLALLTSYKPDKLPVVESGAS